MARASQAALARIRADDPPVAERFEVFLGGIELANGYNGYLPGCEHKQILRDGHEIATVHAEQNAITDCAKRGVSCDECIAYITHYPCIHCMKTLCASGIKTINYINDYHNDDTVSYLAKEASIAINKI